jgi:hypothetical protein
VWTRTYGGPDLDEGHSVEETSDGGCIVAGGTDSFGAGGYDVYVIKTDSIGDTVWTRTYGGPDRDFGYSAEETSDGGYIIAGEAAYLGPSNAFVYLIKTDSIGDTVWTRTYGGGQGYSAEETGDGGYVIGGAYSFGAGGYDVYLIKTDADGLVHVSEQSDENLRTEHRSLAQNYPNPFGTSTSIGYSLLGAQQVTVTVYDIRGAFVRNLVSGTVPAGQHQITWDGRNERGHKVASGVYFCHLETSGRAETRRMVLLR